jgi:hypothetical protein
VLELYVPRQRNRNSARGNFAALGTAKDAQNHGFPDKPQEIGKKIREKAVFGRFFADFDLCDLRLGAKTAVLWQKH